MYSQFAVVVAADVDEADLVMVKPLDVSVNVPVDAGAVADSSPEVSSSAGTVVVVVGATVVEVVEEVGATVVVVVVVVVVVAVPAVMEAGVVTDAHNENSTLPVAVRLPDDMLTVTDDASVETEAPLTERPSAAASTIAERGRLSSERHVATPARPAASRVRSTDAFNEFSFTRWKTGTEIPAITPSTSKTTISSSSVNPPKRERGEREAGATVERS